MLIFQRLILTSAWLGFVGVAGAQMKVETSGEKIRITHNGGLVTEYCCDAKVPYLYPISAPSGSNLARNWPMNDQVVDEEKDHPHHRSFWMSHGSVNGFDFWAWTGKHDARIKHLSIEKAGSLPGKNGASFSVKLAWIANGDVLLHEVRHVTVHDVDDRTRLIDTDSTLTAAAAQVVFGDTKEGFFAFRADRTLRLKGATAKGGILDSEGRTNLQCWGKRAKWVAFHGPDERGEQATIVLMDHVENLRHPTWWHARDYGLLAANPFGIRDFEGKNAKMSGNYTLQKDQTLRFRYRLVLHRGLPDQAKIGSLWSAFTNP